MKKITLFTLLFGFILGINAQLDRYTLTEDSGWQEVSSSATTLYTTGDDEETTGVPIGFDFFYRGTMYNTCTVGLNGAISFTETNISYSNDLASTSASKINMIAPLWDDLELYAANNGWIKYETIGTAPNRIFKVEWKNISKHSTTQSDGSKHFTFMLELHETSNEIVFGYGHNASTVMNASIGLNANDGTNTTFLSITPGSPATTSTSTANNSISPTEFPPNPKKYILTFNGAYNDYNFNALPITLAAPRDATHTSYYMNNIEATNTGGTNVPTCFDFQGGDVWFKFTAPSTGAVNIIREATGGVGAMGYAVYHNSYNDPVQYCSGVSNTHVGERFLIKDLVDGDTYYLRMWDYGNDNFGIVPFYLETIEVNDEAANAKGINVQPENASLFLLTFANNTYTTGSEAINGTPGCGNYSGGDLWYKFTATSTGEVKVHHSDTAGDWSSLAFAVYDSETSNTAIFCDFIPVTGTPPFNTPTISGLTAGNEYWLRVWDYGDNDLGSSGAFYLTDNTAGIEDYKTLSFEYFPNPATDILNVKSQTNIDIITLTNLIGQQVLQVKPQAQTTRLQIGSLDQGVYLMTVKTGDKMTTVKVIKK